ncbi:hypothetical protein BDS110ZK4_73450 [Bradyrhizobium diazoefficiens]|uniref:Uncharacterized protein n=1 Tax=Bradyrhizobium diazoefficiens TaxID=1355477 RepID=A0A809WSI7_9BRAD|nr:hypothetical protein H12S4_04880 [Bradyrhizobium diazoefficiens]BCA08635.1 hypothetical protein BDHF08_04820 [Bradyrhizobium diazoefficiens]BCA17271.1 hypothetical protein BDHH15_04860 [Bradyrhizobium diazoefficiens]BCE17886.1 hypothetical protein XF1B_05670 [Bradyrhizobium diazoefficiens]BCE44138.1 hypothetical protein XF4B_04870 [Bradyrhizobium diazoefficiens]
MSKAESQLAVPLTITTFLDSSVVSRPKGSAVWTGAGVAATAGAVGLGEVLAAGAGDAAGAGEALAAGEGVATGAGEALAAGAGEADGAGEGLAEAAGAGLCARAPDSPSDKAAAGISAARARRRKVFILFSPRPWSSKALIHQDLTHQGLNLAARPGSREPRRSNTRAPNSSHDRCVMANVLAPGGKSLAKRPRIAI